MPQVRAIASYKLKAMMTEMDSRGSVAGAPDADAQVANAGILPARSSDSWRPSPRRSGWRCRKPTRGADGQPAMKG